MPTNTAPERRLRAIGSIVTSLLNDDRTAVAPGITRHDAALKIIDLYALGRTERWETALANWQRMINDPTHTLYWAITQGAIFAGFEAL